MKKFIMAAVLAALTIPVVSTVNAQPKPKLPPPPPARVIPRIELNFGTGDPYYNYRNNFYGRPYTGYRRDYRDYYYNEREYKRTWVPGHWENGIWIPGQYEWVRTW